MADPEILKCGAEDNVSVLSSFVARVHNELYVFYTGKGDLLKKSEAPPPPSLEPPLHIIRVGHRLDSSMELDNWVETNACILMF